MPKIAIVGTTSWGKTLAFILAKNGREVRLWARTEKEAAKFRDTGPASTPSDIPLPPKLVVTHLLGEAMDKAKAVILAVPSQTVRRNVRLLKKYLDDSTIIISAAKGLEIGTNKRMSEVVADEIGSQYLKNICVLSGPNLSPEILEDLPAATVVAAEDERVSRAVQKLVATPNFCVYTNTDVVGVELGGALKNIIALGAGIADGLGYGDNAKAAFITRALTEVTALGVALGANPLTFSGLAGLGDVIATCSSSLSRNHYVGEELTKGRSLAEITRSMVGVAEGVSTTTVALDIARKIGLEMPITERIYQVLYDGIEPRKAAEELMTAESKHELVGRKWKLVSLFRRRKRSLK